MFYYMPKIVGVTWPKPRSFLGKNYLRTRSAFPRRSYLPNLKSLAQAVLKICSIVCQKFQGSRNPFWGKLFMHPVGIPCAKLRTKFEFSSSNSFEDILDRLPKNLGVTW